MECNLMPMRSMPDTRVIRLTVNPLLPVPPSLPVERLSR